MQIEWTTLMNKYWTCGWLKTQTDVMESANEIKEACNRNPPTNDELCFVIRWMAGPEGKQDKCPTLRELIRAIFICRKKARQEQDGFRPGENVEADCRAAMIRATRHRDRWNILNQPTMYAGASRDTLQEECVRLYDWACDRWKDFESAVDAIKLAYCDDLRQFRIGERDTTPSGRLLADIDATPF